MSENNPEEAKTVSLSELTKADFPKPNPAAIDATAAREAAANAESGGNPPELAGFNPDIHESPPRKNKFGEWAKRRGNKKGVFGKPAAPENDNRPKLNIPPSSEQAAAQETAAASAAVNLEFSTEQTAVVVSQCFFGALNIWSGYVAESAEFEAHKSAGYRYLMSRGGCELPPWAELAAVSFMSISKAARTEKAQSKIQKFKAWIAGKVYAFRNRKSVGIQKDDGKK